MGRGLQQTLVPVGVQRVGELLEAAVVCGAGAGPAANRSCHRLNPLQEEEGRKEGRRGGGEGKESIEGMMEKKVSERAKLLKRLHLKRKLSEE